MTPKQPEPTSAGQRIADLFLGKRQRPARRTPLDDGSVLDVRCPRCAAALRARCGRTNSCPRCGERVTVPGADVARSLMPVSGGELTVLTSLSDGADQRRLPAPMLVIDYQRPHYLVRVRGEQTGWVDEAGTRLVRPTPPTKRS
jgi:hypothetical protein